MDGWSNPKMDLYDTVKRVNVAPQIAADRLAHQRYIESNPNEVRDYVPRVIRVWGCVCGCVKH